MMSLDAGGRSVPALLFAADSDPAFNARLAAVGQRLGARVECFDSVDVLATRMAEGTPHVVVIGEASIDDARVHGPHQTVVTVGALDAFAPIDGLRPWMRTNRVISRQLDVETLAAEIAIAIAAAGGIVRETASGAREQLGLVQLEYAIALPARGEQVDQASIAYARTGGTEPLQSLAHRIVGTAGTYGFEDVSRRAAALEAAASEGTSEPWILECARRLSDSMRAASPVRAPSVRIAEAVWPRSVLLLSENGAFKRSRRADLAARAVPDVFVSALGDVGPKALRGAPDAVICEPGDATLSEADLRRALGRLVPASTPIAFVGSPVLLASDRAITVPERTSTEDVLRALRELALPTDVGANVAVLDPDPEAQTGLTRVFEAFGIDASAVDSARTLRELIACRRPGVIVIDVDRPGPSGLAACRALHNDPPSSDIPIVLASRYMTPTSLVAAKACGAADCLHTPFDEESTRRILDWLRAGELERRVANGDSLVEPTRVRELIDRSARAAARRSGVDARLDGVLLLEIDELVRRDEQGVLEAARRDEAVGCVIRRVFRSVDAVASWEPGRFAVFMSEGLDRELLPSIASWIEARLKMARVLGETVSSATITGIARAIGSGDEDGRLMPRLSEALRERAASGLAGLASLDERS